MSAEKTRECPKCKGTAVLIVPLKTGMDNRMAVYGCAACGYTCRYDGGVFVDDPKKLVDVFRGATLGHQTLVGALKGESLNPATKMLLEARILEYGMQMWFDGLKQGLLMGAVRGEYESKHPETADSGVPTGK